MAVLQLHSLRIPNTSTNSSHVVTTRSTLSTGSSPQSVPTPKTKSNSYNRLISKIKSNSLSFALSGTLALSVALSGVGFAEAKVGVNKPELLPKEFTTVIDVAGFLSDGQEKRLAKEIDSIEKDTGFKLRVLAQNYPDTPGLAIKDFWQVDDRTIVFVADPTFGNILNFNVGETVDLDIPRSFWSRLAGKYGNMFYWKEKGEDASVEAAVMAISNCLREPVGANNCAEVKVVIKGRVQGVFYRDWTVQNATELGLKGWVRNRRDGSVEALFSGSENKVGEMQERCRRGPPSAMVTGVNVSPCTEDPGTGFERRPTV